ncbi:MAG: hypothetical protein R3Y15_02600 [Rikenellaceae bacterium]
MKFNITRLSLATTSIITLSLLVLFCNKALLYPLDFEQTGLLPIANQINNFFAQQTTYIQAIVAAFIMIICAMKLTRVVARYSVFKGRTYMPAIIFTIFAGYFLELNQISILGAIFYLICFIESLYNTLKDPNASGKVLLAYTYLGLAIMLCPQACIYALMVPLGMTIINSSWAYALAALVGLMIPISTYGYVSHFFLDYPASGIIDIYANILVDNSGFIVESIQIVDYKNPYDIATALFALTTLISTILAFVWSYSNSENMRTRQSKSFRLTSYLILLGTFTMLSCIEPAKFLGFLAIPLSIIIPSFYIYRQSKITSLLYVLLLISSIASLALR